MSEVAKILNRLNKEYRALGNQTITMGASVDQLTVPTNSVYAIVYVESDVASGYAIRYWTDGFAPTTTEGIPREPDTAFDIEGIHNLHKFRAVKAQAGNTKLQVQFYE